MSNSEYVLMIIHRTKSPRRDFLVSASSEAAKIAMRFTYISVEFQFPATWTWEKCEDFEADYYAAL